MRLQNWGPRRLTGLTLSPDDVHINSILLLCNLTRTHPGARLY